MKRGKPKCQKSKLLLFMKNDEMSKGPHASPVGLGDEPKSPAGLGYVRKYVGFG